MIAAGLFIAALAVAQDKDAQKKAVITAAATNNAAKSTSAPANGQDSQRANKVESLTVKQ